MYLFNMPSLFRSLNFLYHVRSHLLCAVSCIMNKESSDTFLPSDWTDNVLLLYSAVWREQAGDVWCDQWVCETLHPALPCGESGCVWIAINEEFTESCGQAHEHSLCPQQQLLTFQNSRFLFLDSVT